MIKEINSKNMTEASRKLTGIFSKINHINEDQYIEYMEARKMSAPIFSIFGTKAIKFNKRLFYTDTLHISRHIRNRKPSGMLCELEQGLRIF